MTTDKCTHKGQDGNFCADCGAQLKTKCPKCGEMEPTGRPVCLAKIKKIQSRIEETKRQGAKKWETLQLLWLIAIPLLFFAIVIKGKFIAAMLGVSLPIPVRGRELIILLLSAVVWSAIPPLLGEKSSQAQRNAKQEFLSQHSNLRYLLDQHKNWLNPQIKKGETK